MYISESDMAGRVLKQTRISIELMTTSSCLPTSQPANGLRGRRMRSRQVIEAYSEYHLSTTSAF